MRARLSRATRQPIKFGLVGIANTGIDLGCFWLLVTWLQTPPLIANTLSYSLGILNSFLLNRAWTFGGTRFHQARTQQFQRFVLVSLIGLGVSNAVLWTLVHALPLLAAKVGSIAVTFVWNFARQQALRLQWRRAPASGAASGPLARGHLRRRAGTENAAPRAAACGRAPEPLATPPQSLTVRTTVSGVLCLATRASLYSHSERT